MRFLVFEVQPKDDELFGPRGGERRNEESVDDEDNQQRQKQGGLNARRPKDGSTELEHGYNLLVVRKVEWEFEEKEAGCVEPKQEQDHYELLCSEGVRQQGRMQGAGRRKGEG